MIETIRSIPNYSEMSAEDIESHLSEMVPKPDSIYTFNMLCTELNDVILVETLIAHMRLNGLNASADSLISRGVDFSLPQTIQMLDLLSTANPEEFTEDIVTAFKLLGTQTRWASYGNTGDVPDTEQIETALNAINNDNSVEADETRHEVLLSCNRGTDGTLRVMARVTPVEFVEGVELRRGESRILVNDAALVAALSPIVGGLIDA